MGEGVRGEGAPWGGRLGRPQEQGQVEEEVVEEGAQLSFEGVEGGQRGSEGPRAPLDEGQEAEGVPGEEGGQL